MGEPKLALDPQQGPSSSGKRRNRRKPKTKWSLDEAEPSSGDPNSPEVVLPELWMKFGTSVMPSIDGYYRTHEGLSLHGRLKPLLVYPVEVLALCRTFRYTGSHLEGSGKAVLTVQPPKRTPGLSNHEFYALWAEDILRYVAKGLRITHGKDPALRRYLRNKEVLEFMRATWDAVLTGYQQERAWYITKYGYSPTLNSRRLQGVERFRNQLVYHPLEAAQRAKACAQACRAWYYGASKPHGRLLVFEEKMPAMLASYIARALPPAPKDKTGLEGLLSRLTSEPKPEPTYWRPFLRTYVERWGPTLGPKELYTMPSANAALGYPRSEGGHVMGVQHIVLLGYALKKKRSQSGHLPIGEDADGTYLEMLSQSLHPSTIGGGGGAEALFRKPWDTLEKELPDCGRFLQSYLRLGVEYIMDSIDVLPILPIVAEEKGLKTRFPTCGLTAANLVQQILRRVADHVMIRDPRFSEALGGPLRMDMRGEDGPWESQDCTAATDFHPEWLTRGFYEELAQRYPSLRPYQRWFSKLFGPKKILSCPPDEIRPEKLLEQYPKAPLLDDDFLSSSRRGLLGRSNIDHAHHVLDMWNEWIDKLNAAPGTITTTGQMMGDPTSFPALMLVSLCAADETLKAYPYTPKERKRYYRGLNRTDAKLRAVGDDACLPRWNRLRQQRYYYHLEELSATLSWQKCFNHPTRALIAEIPLESGFEVPFWPTSVLVAPPGGSKGHVTWVSQPSAFGGDDTRPTRRIPKFFWKLSPYYYTWMLAKRLGLPLGAPEAYGGIGLPIAPKRSDTDHVRWLSYLSQRPMDELVIGLGLSPLGRSGQSLLDSAASGWVREVLAESANWRAQSLELLSDLALSDDAHLRVSLKEGYRQAVSRIRSVEFYFRAPPESLEPSAPSVRMSSERFRRKVSKTVILGSKMKYERTVRDLERKTNIFFSTSGGFLPDPWAKPSSTYGLECSTEVKMRWKAPWLLGVG
uniref:RNA dependent RNA polymerase n=1 Tax=Downy mildew lesion associated orfanplasmovirus 6 TaxID=3070632 RepID=A0AA51UD04_9VIRU|nr:MAG: putative RNA dependent RNA polymerase [Plasmopara viticola lesion associated orfanplasmovirus 6]